MLFQNMWDIGLNYQLVLLWALSCFKNQESENLFLWSIVQQSMPKTIFNFTFKYHKWSLLYLAHCVFNKKYATYCV